MPVLSVLIVLFLQAARSTPDGSRHSMLRGWPGLAGTFHTKFAYSFLTAVDEIDFSEAHPEVREIQDLDTLPLLPAASAELNAGTIASRQTVSTARRRIAQP